MFFVHVGIFFNLVADKLVESGENIFNGFTHELFNIDALRDVFLDFAHVSQYHILFLDFVSSGFDGLSLMVFICIRAGDHSAAL